MSIRAGRYIGASEREVVALLLVAGIAGLVAILYSSSFVSMVQLWRYGDHHHGVLVFPIAAYFLWRSRHGLAALPVRPWGWGIGLLSVLVLGWVVSRGIGVQAAEHLAAVLLIPAAVATFLGVSIVRFSLFPLLFLIAAVPVGDALVPYLMQITANVSETLLRMAHVPVLREGQIMTLPGGVFEIADVCAGLRYLISGTMMGLLFAYTTFRSNWKRAMFVGVAAVALIFANGVRAFVVMFVASATEMRYLAGRDHVVFGWLMFGIVVMALFWGGQRFADEQDAQIVSEQGGVGGGWKQGRDLLPLVLGLAMLATTGQPLIKFLGSTWILVLPAGGLLISVLYRRFRGFQSIDAPKSQRDHGGRRRIGTFSVILAAVSVLGAGPALVGRSSEPAADNSPSLQLPAVAGCSPPGAWAPDWQPEVLAPDFRVAGTYACDEKPVSVFVAGYYQSIQGKELINDQNELLPPRLRRYTSIREAEFETSAGHKIRVVEAEIRSRELQYLVWYWYAVGGHTTSSSIGVKLLQAYQFVASGSVEGRVYLVQTPLGAEAEAARSRLAVVARGAAATVVPKQKMAGSSGDGS